MKPILKWVGGKAKLVKHILAAMPDGLEQAIVTGLKGQRLIEPFAGGAALFFALAPRFALLNDRNKELINTYATCAEHCLRVYRQADVHRSRHNRAYYERVRARYNAGTQRGLWEEADAIWRAGTFLYLNRNCFNGVWRVNRDGEFNVPMGRYAHANIVDRDTLVAGAAQLKRAKLWSLPFEDAISDATPGDLIYADPPYDPSTVTANFTSYTGDRFTRDDQHNLALSLLKARIAGAHVITSNSDTPYIWSLYPKRDGWRHVRVRRQGTINSRKDRRGKVNELIIVGLAER